MPNKKKSIKISREEKLRQSIIRLENQLNDKFDDDFEERQIKAIRIHCANFNRTNLTIDSFVKKTGYRQRKRITL